MSKKHGNRNAFVQIGAVIDTLLRQQRGSKDKALLDVWDVWAQAVGPAIADNAQPAAFKGDLLLVNVRSSTWLHHLHFLEKEMIAKINAALGEKRIRSIKYKIGSF